MNESIQNYLNSSVNGMSYESGSNTVKLTAEHTLTPVGSTGGSLWGFWQDNFYPTVIRESYPVYLQERAKDQGKQAFEIIKALQDKKLVKLDKVSDFIEAMDTLIKIL